MKTSPGTQHDSMISALYEASKQGSVSTLKGLLETDPLILSKLSLTTFSETPLHISASFGHVDFIRTLLKCKPRLASDLDSLHRSPLHFASAEGHTDVVKELLKYGDACLVLDQDGSIPLHYAVMRGRANVVRELIRAKPESLKVLDRGDTVLHLCIKYNQLETLKVLVDFVGDKSEILNTRDHNENTILHLAVMLKQTENIEYLLSLSAIKEAANAKNRMGFTALDVLEHSLSDYKCLKLRCLLMEAGINGQRNNSDGLQLQQNSANRVAVTNAVGRTGEKKWWKKCLNYMNNLFKHEDDWLKDTHGNLMIVATVISTMSYQVILQPPEFVKKGDDDLGVLFMVCNSFSFVTSISVILLLLSGLPLRNKFSVWLLSLLIYINLIVLGFAYLLGGTKALTGTNQLYFLLYSGITIILFVVLIVVSVLFLTIRFFVWIGKMLYRIFKWMRTSFWKNVEAPVINSTQATTTPV